MCAKDFAEKINLFYISFIYHNLSHLADNTYKTSYGRAAGVKIYGYIWHNNKEVLIRWSYVIAFYNYYYHINTGSYSSKLFCLHVWNQEISNPSAKSLFLISLSNNSLGHYVHVIIQTINCL